MNRRSYLSGLYAITPASPEISDAQLEQQAAAALAGGARILQFRDKGSDPEQRMLRARRLADACRSAGALFIINDDTQLAKAIGADGVHLGRHDTDIHQARRLLGADALVGVSCYNQPQLALEAAATGADYIALGRFFPSRTKPDAVQCDLAQLLEVRSQLQLPIVAIGGITPENGAPLIAAGADMLAVIDGIFGQPDIAAACQSFQSLFKSMER